MEEFNLDNLDGDALDAAAETQSRVPARILRIIETAQRLAADERTNPAERDTAGKKADELIKKYRVHPAALAMVLMVLAIFI